MPIDDAALLEKYERVGLISFNRPERLNAGDSGTGEALRACFAEAASDDEIGAIVLTGVGRAFSAGANLKDAATHTVPDPDEYLSARREQTAFDALQHFPKPTLAAVNGYAIGFGCLAALCCDFVFINEHAVFALPQVSLGVLPAYGGTLRLARFVGRGNALDMSLTGRHVRAEEALRMGIASQLYPAEHLIEESIATMNKIAAMPVHAVRLARESLRYGYDSGLPAAEQADIYRFMALSQTRDSADRHEAWRTSRGAST